MRLPLTALRLWAGAGAAAGLVLALLATLWHVAWLEAAGDSGEARLHPGIFAAAELVPAKPADARAEAARANDAAPRLHPPAPDDPALAPGEAHPLFDAPAVARASFAATWPDPEASTVYASRAPPGSA
jgi:hypothetical protein